MLKIYCCKCSYLHKMTFENIVFFQTQYKVDVKIGCPTFLLFSNREKVTPKL